MNRSQKALLNSQRTVAKLINGLAYQKPAQRSIAVSSACGYEIKNRQGRDFIKIAESAEENLVKTSKQPKKIPVRKSE
ncbi:MAG: hypothetical protein LAT67_07640 [Balneolales bacterium]|nr:hypothetical protein [Balneolales bacterium]